MMSKRLKLHRITTIFWRCGTNLFPTHNHAKLHHLATLFDNTNGNMVSNPEKGNHIVRGVFCLIFTKSCQIHCQITNNISEILMSKDWQNFFIERFSLSMDPILIVLLRLFRQNSKFKSGGQAPSEKKWGPRPIRPPVPPPVPDT